MYRITYSHLRVLGWVPSAEANVYVANHDTERLGSSITYKWDRNAYTLATIFSLAYPYGTPTILSGYKFTDYDAGAPNNGKSAILSLDV